MYRDLKFTPFAWVKSPHAQMFLATYLWTGFEPPTKPMWVDLSHGDKLCCGVSTPIEWTQSGKTVVLIHGLGGDQTSHYMIRISSKLYQKGIRVVRVNLRGCGPGKSLSKLPYNGGTSPDLLAVLNKLKTLSPKSDITAVGFSLGGNILLKLLGELGTGAHALVDRAIAVCPPIDLGNTIEHICSDNNRVYHRYYLNSLLKQTQKWAVGKKINTVYEFDEEITAPCWGYQSAADYYDKASSGRFISHINVPCDILFAKDDPFISYEPLNTIHIPTCVRIWVAPHGGHMGFIGAPWSEQGFFWLDNIVIKWIMEQR